MRPDQGQSRLGCETAARCAVTGCIHWGRTELRLHALRYMNDFLTKTLHHHTQWEGYRSIGKATAADRQMCDAQDSTMGPFTLACANVNFYPPSFLFAAIEWNCLWCQLAAGTPAFAFFSRLDWCCRYTRSDAAPTGDEVPVDPVELRHGVETQPKKVSSSECVRARMYMLDVDVDMVARRIRRGICDITPQNQEEDLSTDGELHPHPAFLRLLLFHQICL